MFEGKNNQINYHLFKKMHSQISDNDLQIEEHHHKSQATPKSAHRLLKKLIGLKRPSARAINQKALNK